MRQIKSVCERRNTREVLYVAKVRESNFVEQQSCRHQSECWPCLLDDIQQRERNVYVASRQQAMFTQHNN